MRTQVMEVEIKKQPEKEKESGVTIVISLTRPRRPIGSYMGETQQVKIVLGIIIAQSYFDPFSFFSLCHSQPYYVITNQENLEERVVQRLNQLVLCFYSRRSNPQSGEHLTSPDLDLPIALRKGVRNHKVVQEEMSAVEKNDTWELMSLPKRKSTMGYQWVGHAFLNGKLDEKVSMDLPPRFGKEIKSHDFTQAQVDHTLFFKHSQDGKITIFIVCIDDIILIGDNIGEMENLKGILAKEFEIKEQTRNFGLTKEIYP
ncbi:hypothetical protein CK203_050703 [Vitis vinifera]|uniref:Reverse transcriptase Ty1/copia-type domain-containing protein n=1 Tax=Vitis vinifera TaxID=29760 RepID=A0A438H8W6_VITVI|nr:hypothetical protein CK203_050703 [Vitis vinifera]